MLGKLLVLIAFVVLLMYAVLPRGGRAATAPGPARRTFFVLLLAAAALLAAAIGCLAFWLGERWAGTGHENTTLLPVAGVLFALSLACAGVAQLKRRG